MKVVTTRLTEKVLGDLKLVEEVERADRAIVVRKLLVEALKDWKIEFALNKLKHREISISKAAELAGMPFSDMMHLMAENKIDIGYTREDLARDMKKIKKGHKWQ